MKKYFSTFSGIAGMELGIGDRAKECGCSPSQSERDCRDCRTGGLKD